MHDEDAGPRALGRVVPGEVTFQVHALGLVGHLLGLDLRTSDAAVHQNDGRDDQQFHPHGCSFAEVTNSALGRR